VSPVRVVGPQSVRGRIRVPGDKSISHRALLLAGAAQGKCVVRGLATGDDVARTRRLVESLGVTVREQPDALVVTGVGWDGLREPADIIDCGNSGTTVRIGLGYLAGRPGYAVLTGDASIARRPMLRVVEPLRVMGAAIDGRDAGALTPLSIRGGNLRGGRHELAVASAQVKSALLFAGLQASGVTEIASPARSRDHTERMFMGLGLPVSEDDAVVRVEAADVPAFEIDVPGDASSAAFWIVAALVTPGSEVVVEGVSLNPTRVHFVEVLRRMGAAIEIDVQGESCGEPFGTITASTSELTGTLIAGDEIPLVLDEIPALAVAGAFAEGPTEVRDADELVVKESDRIGAIHQELSQMGVGVEARRDGLLIQGGRPLAARFKSHGDHRIAMAAATAALGCEGESQIQGWAAVATSYPGFSADLEALTGYAMEEFA